VVSVSVIPQAAGNLIEHNDAQARPTKKKFFRERFPCHTLTSCIAREPKKLEPNSIIAGGVRNPKVSRKVPILIKVKQIKQQEEAGI